VVDYLGLNYFKSIIRNGYLSFLFFIPFLIANHLNLTSMFNILKNKLFVRVKIINEICILMDEVNKKMKRME